MMFGKRHSPSADAVLAHRIERAVARVASPPAQRLRAARNIIYRQAELRLITGARVVVVIRNLSDTGALVEFVERGQLSNGIGVTVLALKMHRPARVVWQGAGAAGLVFLGQGDA